MLCNLHYIILRVYNMKWSSEKECRYVLSSEVLCLCAESSRYNKIEFWKFRLVCRLNRLFFFLIYNKTYILQYPTKKLFFSKWTFPILREKERHDSGRDRWVRFFFISYLLFLFCYVQLKNAICIIFYNIYKHMQIHRAV